MTAHTFYAPLRDALSKAILPQVACRSLRGALEQLGRHI